MSKIFCQNFNRSFGSVVCGISTDQPIFFYKINLQDRIKKKSRDIRRIGDTLLGTSIDDHRLIFLVDHRLLFPNRFSSTVKQKKENRNITHWYKGMLDIHDTSQR